MPSKVCDEITYPFPNFNGVPTFYNGCNYLSMLGLNLNHVRKKGPEYDWCQDGTSIYMAVMGRLHVRLTRKYMSYDTFYILNLVIFYKIWLLSVVVVHCEIYNVWRKAQQDLVPQKYFIGDVWQQNPYNGIWHKNIPQNPMTSTGSIPVTEINYISIVLGQE